MKSIKILVIILSVFACKENSNALPLIIFADDFNAESLGLNYNSFTNWDVTGGTVDVVIGNTYGLNIPLSYGHFVDMDGSSHNAGKIETKTTFNLAPGTYSLMFDLAGNRRNNSPDQVDVQVGVGGLFSESFSLNRNDPFQTYNKTFQVNSLTGAKISFEGLGGDNVGMLLDNVKLTLVPEPGTVMLLGFGLLGLGLFGRFRKQRI